jgi:hypothetical protein
MVGFVRQHHRQIIISVSANEGVRSMGAGRVTKLGRGETLGKGGGRIDGAL